MPKQTCALKRLRMVVRVSYLHSKPTCVLRSPAQLHTILTSIAIAVVADVDDVVVRIAVIMFACTCIVANDVTVVVDICVLLRVTCL